MKASVLGIGTELTDGQIVNKNASWISGKLKEYGLLTNTHIVVPDERTLILDAIEFCANKSDIIFVTGGLGPTSDDFTRDIISEWTAKKLEFHQESWDHLSERLTSRGYTVKEIQKQQCYFPQTAQVLKNSQGTANGFQMQHQGKMLFVLPGPPREIEAIWNDFVNTWLKQNTTNLDPFITRKFDTIGVGESDVAIIVEDILKGIPVEKGYRVHLPYVEVKVSFHKSEAEKHSSVVEKLAEALKYCTVTRDGEDVAVELCRKLQTFAGFHISDQVSGAFLSNRLMPHLRNLMSDKYWTISNQPSLLPQDVEFDLISIDEHSCEVGLKIKQRKLKTVITAPYKTTNMRERRLQYFAEMALVFWAKNLN